MLVIKDISDKYRKKLDYLDLELIISRVIKKPREFILAHPEVSVNNEQESMINNLIRRRIKKEPLAYILGCKEFYGLDFKVNKDVLIPRPETEMLVGLAVKNILQTKNHPSADEAGKPRTIIDIGTGSGNIIISIANELKKLKTINYKLFGIDISEKALSVAKKNAKNNNVAKKISFIQGNLLEPIIENLKRYVLRDTCYVTILANLPYLSKRIYSETKPCVKNFEPKSALLSSRGGLAHYEKLFKQIKRLQKHCYVLRVMCYVEISPEQKELLEKMIQCFFPDTKVKFHRDLAKKWRLAEFNL